MDYETWKALIPGIDDATARVAWNTVIAYAADVCLHPTDADYDQVTGYWYWDPLSCNAALLNRRV